MGALPAMRLLLLALGAAVLLPGCYVLEELDKAEAQMDAYTASGKQRAEETAPAPEPGAEGPGVLDRLGGWWEKATTPAPPPPDPNNTLVRCDLPGGARFTRRYDCQGLGGRIARTLPPAGADAKDGDASR